MSKKKAVVNSKKGVTTTKTATLNDYNFEYENLNVKDANFKLATVDDDGDTDGKPGIGKMKQEINKLSFNATQMKEIMNPPTKNKSKLNSEKSVEKAVEKTVEKENVILKESWNVNDLNLDANNEAIIESINGNFVNELATTKAVDFSGACNSTDYVFYLIAKKISSSNLKSTIASNNVTFNFKGCKYISLMSCHYMFKSIGRSLDDWPDSVKNLLPENKEITENILVSLQKLDKKLNETPNLKGMSASKTVIIHDDTEKFSIIDFLRSAENIQERPIVDYCTLKYNNKDLNIFECSESISHVFLSHRNTIIFPFNCDINIDDSIFSIIKRLKGVCLKNNLPQEVLVIGISQEKNVFNSAKFFEMIKNELNKLNEKLITEVETQIKHNIKCTFQEQMLLSNKINFSEKLKILVGHIRLAIFDKNDKKAILQFYEEAKSDTSTTSNELIQNYEMELNIARKGLQSISKSSFVEIKSYAAPPRAVEAVAEATCILFATKPLYDNFKKLLNQRDLITSLCNYDPDSISDYALNELKKYINDPNFKQEYVVRISVACAAICQLIIALYNFKTTKNLIEIEEQNKSDRLFQKNTNLNGSASFIDTIAEVSYKMFAWPFYYEMTSNEKIPMANAAIHKMNLTDSRFLSLDKFKKMFEDNVTLNELSKTVYPNLYEKYARSESANGSILFHEDLANCYLITDIPWFCKVFNHICQYLPAESDKKVYIETIKAYLKNEIASELIDSLINYLDEINLIKLINNKLECVSIVSPIRSVSIKLPKYWSANWKGLEMSKYFDIDCVFPVDSILNFINISDERKISLIWKSGVLIEENLANILLESAENKYLKLSVRMIDPKMQLNIDVAQTNNYLEYTFMKYQLMLHYILKTRGIPTQFEKYANTKSQEDEKNKIGYYSNYCNQHFNVKHEIWNVKNERCDYCFLDLNVVKEISKCISIIYPVMDLKIKININNQDITSLINKKLEARDRKNPNICAPATIIEVSDSNKILIHFDGWGNTYDYWANLEDEDILPCGFWGNSNYFENGTYLTMRRFDKPKNYPKFVFDWIVYLNETDSKAVPLNMFSEKKRVGVNEKIFKDFIACLGTFNPNLKLLQVSRHLEKNLENLVHSFVIKNNNNDDGRRGIVLLPSQIDSYLEWTPIINNFEILNLSFHQTCITCGDEDEDSTIYTHMIDTEGVIVKPKLLNQQLINLLVLSAYLLSSSTNPIIVPSRNKIIKTNDINNDQLSLMEINQIFRKYFKNIFRLLSHFFDQQLSMTEFDIGEIIKEIPKEKLKTSEYTFTGSGCYFCHLCDFNPWETVNDRIAQTGVYGKCIMKMHVFNNDPAKLKESIFLDDKFFNHFTVLKSIHLVNCQVVINESSVKEENLKMLKNIKFENNEIKEFPSIIKKMKNLKKIVIENSPLKSIPNSLNLFETKSYLKELSLNKLPLSQESAVSNKVNLMKLPNNMEKLEMNHLAFDFIPFDLKNCENTLKWFSFEAFPWITVDEFGGSSGLFSFENLSNKYSSLMTHEELLKLFKDYDFDGNNLLTIKEIYKLNAFIFKKYPRLQSDEKFGGIPETIFFIKNLTHLNLSFHAISKVPDEINELKFLNDLRLDNCIYLEEISPKLSECPITNISLSNCDSIKTPPLEIVKRGTKSIISYLKRLASGSVECKRTKLMLVGLGEAGKTSLVHALQDKHDHEQPNLTDGINIEEWSVDIDENSKLKFSIWDFAGQSVYYNTHQFFLTSRAVYILVWNIRLGAEYAGLNFWLSSISCHAPESPIFVVGTHVDQVAKFKLNESELKKNYKQIVGFHYVSCINNTGIEELTEQLKAVALREKYMGEFIPNAWLKFEDLIKTESKKSEIATFEDISKIAADECGLIEYNEILQAVRFLKDLGSLQYFENPTLKDKIVINPQWIVDLMACLVSVRETSVQNGNLYHKDIPKIWSNYDPSLYDWILKLTEEFDLTFPLKDGNLSLVPCLLSDQEPSYEWPEILENQYSHKKELKVLYLFSYLPAGLFNRLQVRLYQYANGSTIWKNGSLLKKNDHLALITQEKNEIIKIKVQGTKPENIIYVIHEVLEVLINESFNGIEYDCCFPCLDCVDARISDPHMFKVSLIRRAIALKAPFLQCSKSFHLVSITELQTLVPVDKESNMDFQLENSIRDLNHLKNKLKYDIAIWYSPFDVPKSEGDKLEKVNPLAVVDALKKYGYNVWYSNNPSDEKFEKISYALKESKVVLMGISDAFANDEKSVQVFELAKNMIRKNCITIEFGNTRRWLENSTFASICADYRCIMQDPSRITHKLAELCETLDRQLGIDEKRSNGHHKTAPDVFISYCWANSHEAVKKGSKASSNSLGWLDPRHLKEILESHGISVWLDVNESSNSSNLFNEITKGINKARVVIACLSDEYVNSKNCVLEFRFAHCSLKKPIFKALVGTGNNWRTHEISFLGGIYPEVNCQFENSEGLNQLVEQIKNELNKLKEKAINENSDSIMEPTNDISTYQELYELAQRKFLRQLVQFSEKDQYKTYPRLIFIDLMEKQELERIVKREVLRIKKNNSGKEDVDVYKRETDDGAEKTDQETTKNEISIDDTSNESLVDIKLIGNIESILSFLSSTKSEYIPGFSVLCENEENWHKSNCFLPISNLQTNWYSYLTRIINLLKNGPLSTDLRIFTLKEGRSLINKITTSQEIHEVSINESYLKLGNYFYQTLFESTEAAEDAVETLGLKKYHLQNGKTLWLCETHAKEIGAKLADLEKNISSSHLFGEKNQLLEEIRLLEKINLNQA